MTDRGRPAARGLTRRSVLGAACAAALAGPALAEQKLGPPPHLKGERVFLDYDQVELDAAYDQAAYAPNLEQITARYASQSELVRARIGAPERAAYGESEIEKLDIYRARRRGAPIMIFIHGGAWRGGAAKNYAYPAEMLVAAGAHYVVPDFIAVQDAQGSLMAMAEQVRRAVAWVYRNARRFGGDRRRLYLAGHSSGGHLAGVALTTDWPARGLPAGIIKGAVLASGIYDLKGPRLSARSAYVKFDDAVEDALSPQRHLDKLRTPLVIGYGSGDTPEFQRQSRDFAAAVKAAGKPVELIRGDNYNHFEFVETQASPYGLLGRAALEQMRLAGC